MDARTIAEIKIVCLALIDRAEAAEIRLAKLEAVIALMILNKEITRGDLTGLDGLGNPLPGADKAGPH